MGQIGAAQLPAAKGELQYLHSRIAGLFQQAVDLRSEKAKVLSDDVLFPQGAVHRLEKIQAGAGPPAAVAGGGVPVRDGVIGLETPEVVDAQRVIEA